MHPKTPNELCSYAPIPPMVEMSLVLEAPAAQRSQQHQALIHSKEFNSHLKLQAGFPVGSIAKSRAAFSFLVSSKSEPRPGFSSQPLTSGRKQHILACHGIVQYLHSPTMPWPTSHTLHSTKFPGNLLSWNKLARLNLSWWSLCSSMLPVHNTQDSPHP